MSAGRRRRSGAALAAGAVLTVLGCASAESRPEPVPAASGGGETPAFGMTAWRSNEAPRADFALVRRSGAPFYRFDLLTSTTDDRAERPGWVRRYDRLVAAATIEGVELLPLLMRTRPSTREDRHARGGRGRGRSRPRKPVADPPSTAREWAIWRARVRGIAERFGPRGRFWAEHPELPYRPFRAWEVWNEPNLRQFWDAREPDPEEYARLVVETRRVLRAADPHARIVSGGLGWRYSGGRYLRAVLEEAGGCAVDAVGIHPYAPTPARAMRALEEARSIADAAGARGVPLWTTEIGWKVRDRGYAGVPSETAQARSMQRFAGATVRRRSELWLGPSFAFALRDRIDPETGRTDHTAGLRRANDSPRPAWAVWSRWAQGARRLPLPRARECGR